MRVTRLTLMIITLIIVAGLYLVVKMQLDELEPRTFQATEETMVDASELLAALAATHIDETGTFDAASFRAAFDQAHGRSLGALIYEHLKQDVGMHCYITDTRGLVLFDSENGLREGDNYMRFRDVRLTLAGEYGARSSRILTKYGEEGSVLHVASPILHNGRIWGVLTAFKPQQDVLPIVQRRRQAILWGTGMVGLGILAMILAVFIWQYRPIARLTQYARDIEQGKRPPLPELGAGQEVNTLAHALESMREALEGRKYAQRYVETLTHEMKSPLAAICGAAELLDESMPLETRSRFVGNIRAESQRADRLLNRLLELSALEGRTRLEEVRRIDLAELVRQAIDQARPMAELAGVQLEARLPETPIEVSGDPFILRSAVTNLLENAIDFSPAQGAVVIELQELGREACLTIDDQGPGIPDYAQDKVFERFFSLRHHKAGRKGTGLGLTLVRETATLHGGRAELENRTEGGARARLVIPCA